MRRLSILLVSFATTLAFAPNGVAAPANPASNGDKSDVAAMYEAFLNRWSGKSQGPINVAASADAPSSDDLKQYADCAKEIGKPDTQWVPGSKISDLTTVMGKPASIHFIDPKTWRPLDPGALIRSGASVGPVVSAGMAQGLVTLSAVTFNKALDIAVFNFSFVCGGLCGSGFVVVFRKTPKGWVQSKSMCGGYIS
jgi:hypothetical protein